MKTTLNIYKSIIMMAFTLITLLSYAEGTKQLNPNSGDYGNLQINDKSRPFAMESNTDSLHRLFIEIKNSNERICLGFNHIGTGNGTFRILDPSGNVVFGRYNIPSSGTGYINDYNQAVAGPKVNGLPADGYTPYIYSPSTTGSYYIEFTTDLSAAYHFDLFDITVIDSVDNHIDGRLWSYAWDLNTRGGTNPFYGKFYIYSSDGFISQVDMNGIQPYGFVVTSNSTGTGDVIGGNNDNRKSIPGDYMRPEYKIFLNLPDTTVFEIGSFPNILDSVKLVGTPEVGDTVVFSLKISKAGTIEILLDINGTPDYQNGTEDIILIQKVNAGWNYIKWDGKDGLGNQVPGGLNVNIESSYLSGVTHLTLFDPEGHENGFIVTKMYPESGPATLYWDDSELVGGTVNIDGSNPNGHSFPYWNYGNDITINTWWDGYKITNTGSLSFSFDMPLPIILNDFTAKFKDNIVQLDWSTIFEINNNYFSIERSKNGTDWESIGLIEGLELSYFKVFYSFEDNNPYFGISYYRLKQVDYNGSSTYSSVVGVQNKNVYFSLHPNPVYAKGKLIITLQDAIPESLNVCVIKSTGEIIFNELVFPTSEKIIVDVKLNGGIYYIKIATENQSTEKKIVSL